MLRLIPSVENQKALDSVKKSIKQFKDGYRKGLYFTGKAAQAFIRKEMTSGKKTGRLYLVSVGRGGKRLKKPRKHIASGPDEYPAVITGDLRASVGFQVYGFDTMELGANTEYAKDLEVGRGRIKPRRYLEQTVEHFSIHTKTLISTQINNRLRAIGVTVT